MSINPVNYGSPKLLATEFSKMWNQVAKEHPGAQKGKSCGSYKQEAARCAVLYTNAGSKNRSFIVLGETSIRTDEILMQNLGTIATDPVFCKTKAKKYLVDALKPSQKLIKKLTEQHLTQGAVLNEGNWFILPNDIVMLGVIHSGKECHLATTDGAEPKKDVLWDDDNNRPRVLGRELLQLYNAGYRLVRESLGGRGLVLLQTNQDKGSQISLGDIRGTIGKETYESIQKIFQDTVPYSETVQGKQEKSKAEAA